MNHEAMKKRRLIQIPVHMVNEKIFDNSSLVNVLCCTTAVDTPMSVKIPKNAMMTVAMATIQKSSGESKRAKTPDTTNATMIPMYLAKAV